MSALRLAKTLNTLSNHSLSSSKVIICSVRHHWNKEFKPAAYPKTEAERLAAAERYGLHPSEYKPYNDDGSGYGDYPKLKAESGDARDPNYPWDNPEFKRNFNENMHVEFDLIREDRYDVNSKFVPNCTKLFLQFFGVMGGAFFLYWIGEHFKGFHPLKPKQYPEEGKKSYGFE